VRYQAALRPDKKQNPGFDSKAIPALVYPAQSYLGGLKPVIFWFWYAGINACSTLLAISARRLFPIPEGASRTSCWAAIRHQVQQNLRKPEKQYLRPAYLFDRAAGAAGLGWHCAGFGEDQAEAWTRHPPPLIPGAKSHNGTTANRAMLAGCRLLWCPNGRANLLDESHGSPLSLRPAHCWFRTY
jgi:hypothetical protein